MAQLMRSGAAAMHVGTACRWRSAGDRGKLALVLTLIAINMWLWVLVLGDVSTQVPLGDTQLLLTALTALIALGLAVSVWRSPANSTATMLAVPSLRHSLATHQAGHIVAAYSVDPTRLRSAVITRPCHHHSPDIPMVAESALRSEILVALGGIAAEEVFTGESGSHSADDLAGATNVAAAMVGLYGLSGSPVSMLPAARSYRALFKRVLEDPRARKDLEALMREVKRDAVRVLLERRHVVIAVRDALLRRRRLGPEELRALIVHADRHRHEDDKVLVDLRAVGANKSSAEAGG